MPTKRDIFDYAFINHRFVDLNPILAGRESCASGKSWGPGLRNYTLIHYVVKGKGVLYKFGKEFHIHAGEAFLIRPGEIITYTADKDDPWHYQWIGFDGQLSLKINELDDVFPFPSHIISEILECINYELCEYRVAALLFEMYAELMKPHETHTYIDKVKDYIKALYMQPISVEEIALHVGLDRRYLSRIFRGKTGITIQEYIISTRMKEAKKYLLKGHTVEEAAALSGYEDRSNFSKIFKKNFGISPIEWKKTNS